MKDLKQGGFSGDTVTVGIFWVAEDGEEPKLIWESEELPREGKFSVDSAKGHFKEWDRLAKEQHGGAYRKYDCYYFPRGRVLYMCESGKTRVWCAKQILDKLDRYEPILKRLFNLENYEFGFDEHYGNKLKWN
jgi:hypothetical protein